MVDYKHAYPSGFVARLIDDDDCAQWFQMLVTLYDDPNRVSRETSYVQRVFERFRARVLCTSTKVDMSEEFVDAARRDPILYECAEDLLLEEAVLSLWKHLRDPNDRDRAHHDLRRAIEDFKTRSAVCDMPSGDAVVDAGSLDRLQRIVDEAFKYGNFVVGNEGFRRWRVENSRLWFNLRDRCFYSRVNARDLASCDRDQLVEIIDDLRREILGENRRGRKPDPAADKFAREMIDIWIEFTGKSWTHELKTEEAENDFLHFLQEAGKVVDPGFNARTRAENARKQMPKSRKIRRRV